MVIKGLIMGSIILAVFILAKILDKGITLKAKIPLGLASLVILASAARLSQII